MGNLLPTITSNKANRHKSRAPSHQRATDQPTKRLIESRARDFKEKRTEKEEEEKFVDLVDLPTFKSLFARNVNPSIAFEC